MLTYTLTNPKTIIIQSAITKTITAINIKFVVDNPIQKTVTAYTDVDSRALILWKGADYDAIGQWTDEDVLSKIAELYGANDGTSGTAGTAGTGGN